MKKLSWFDKIIFFLNSLLAIALILAYFLPYIPPKSYPLISVLTLGVPILIIANLVFFLYWLLRMKRQMLLSLIIMIVGFGFASKFYKWPFASSERGGKYSIMNYNVRVFGETSIVDAPTAHQDIYDFIAHNDPDIVAIEEYYKQDKIVQNLYPYKYIKFRTDESFFGSAILSKYPIINSGSLDFPVIQYGNNNAIFADIVTDNNDTIRVLAVHFQSLKITEDVQHVEKLRREGNQDKKLVKDLSKGSKKVAKSIANGFAQQQVQAEIVQDFIESSNLPIIISGDFNNTAFSHTYNHVRNDRFQDAYVKKGAGFSSTYHLNYFPLRIDFHLLDTVFEVNSYERIKVPYSDHYPILTTFSVKD